MQRKSIVIAAALVAGLTLGVIMGPVVAGSLANAQTQPPAQSQPTAQAQPPAQAQPSKPGSALQSLFLDKLAAALNIQRSALDSALTSAGISTADAAVQQGTLTQAQADALKARIQAGDLDVFLGGHGGPMGGPRDGAVHQAMFDAAAKALNITTDELMTQLRSGQTLAQLAQAHGTTEQAVTSAALAAAKAQLAQEVSSGNLTQAQADSIYAQLQQQGAQLLTPRGHGRGDRGGFGGLGGPGAPASPQAQPAPTAGPSA